jgi:hypothetical protein
LHPFRDGNIIASLDKRSMTLPTGEGPTFSETAKGMTQFLLRERAAINCFKMYALEV